MLNTCEKRRNFIARWAHIIRIFWRKHLLVWNCVIRILFWWYSCVLSLTKSHKLLLLLLLHTHLTIHNCIDDTVKPNASICLKLSYTTSILCHLHEDVQSERLHTQECANVEIKCSKFRVFDNVCSAHEQRNICVCGSNFGECIWSHSVYNKWYDEADRKCAELKYEMLFSFCAIKIIEEFTKNTTKVFDSCDSLFICWKN